MSESPKIVFRAKRLHYPDDWVYGSLLEDVDNNMYIIPIEDVSDLMDNHTSAGYSVIPDTLEQYTGNTDSEGFMIFGSFNPTKGGSILRTDEADWICRIVYNGDSFMGVDNNGGWSGWLNWKDCRVLGNHLDNPEFLPSKRDQEF